MSEDAAKTGYLVACDNGRGGVWAFVFARSKEEIAGKYPALALPENRPSWMSEETYGLIQSTNGFDIDDEPPEWLTIAMNEKQ